MMNITLLAAQAALADTLAGGIRQSRLCSQ